MWSLISPRAKGISGPEKFWSSPQKDFFNTICHKRTKDRPRSYFGLRGNGINPSRFGILTLGSDCASITSFDPTIPLRLRI